MYQLRAASLPGVATVSSCRILHIVTSSTSPPVRSAQHLSLLPPDTFDAVEGRMTAKLSVPYLSHQVLTCNWKTVIRKEIVRFTSTPRMLERNGCRSHREAWGILFHCSYKLCGTGTYQVENGRNSEVMVA